VKVSSCQNTGRYAHESLDEGKNRIAGNNESKIQPVGKIIINLVEMNLVNSYLERVLGRADVPLLRVDVW